jgi:1-deoxy-D-xylulose-5-phosphate synthase
MAFFRAMPHMIVSSPMNEAELRDLMYTAQLENMGPFAIRYPRGNGSMVNWKTPMKKISVGSGRQLSSGSDLAILSIGPLGVDAQDAVHELSEQGISAAHYDMRFIKPIDETILHEVFGKFKNIITVEDGSIIGGFGSAVIEFMADNNYSAKVVRLGIPDEYIEHGTQEELYALCEYDKAAIIKHAHILVDKKELSSNKAAG